MINSGLCQSVDSTNSKFLDIHGSNGQDPKDLLTSKVNLKLMIEEQEKIILSAQKKIGLIKKIMNESLLDRNIDIEPWPF